MTVAITETKKKREVQVELVNQEMFQTNLDSIAVWEKRAETAKKEMDDYLLKIISQGIAPNSNKVANLAEDFISARNKPSLTLKMMMRWIRKALIVHMKNGNVEVFSVLKSILPNHDVNSVEIREFWNVLTSEDNSDSDEDED